MAKRVTKRIIIVFILLSILASMFSFFSFAENENSSDSSFQGYSGNMTLEELDAETKTSKDGNGDFITPVNTSAPQITFLIPGYGTGASTWCNNYENTIEEKENVGDGEEHENDENKSGYNGNPRADRTCNHRPTARLRTSPLSQPRL